MKQKILDILEQNRGKNISGSQIAKTLNITRSAVWKQINQLRLEGFNIQSTTNLGYCLNISDDIISKSAIKNIFRMILAQIFLYLILYSTTTWQKSFNEGAKEKTLLYKKNNRPKGEADTKDISFSNTEFITVLLKPKSQITNAMHITCLSAVSVCPLA
jgi:BirA family biotin operon repressor/biotin-[acetyl-CoA-carboxylase] ligase